MKPYLRIFFLGDYTWVGVVVDNPAGRGYVAHYSRLLEKRENYEIN